MTVTEKDIEKAAQASRLELEEKEQIAYTESLNEILKFSEILNVLNTNSVEPALHPNPQSNIFRDDRVETSLDKETALANAPLKDGDYFKVPRIV